MNETKFQIDITQGEIAADQMIPSEISDQLCKKLGVSLGKLRDCLSKKDATAILICSQGDVEQILKLFSNIGISAEAQLANSNLDDDEVDSIFGPLDVDSQELGIDEILEEQEDEGELLFDISDDILFETNNEKEPIISHEKQTITTNSLLFDESEDDEITSLESTPIKTNSEILKEKKTGLDNKSKLMPQQLSVSFEEEDEKKEGKIGDEEKVKELFTEEKILTDSNKESNNDHSQNLSNNNASFQPPTESFSFKNKENNHDTKNDNTYNQISNARLWYSQKKIPIAAGLVLSFCLAIFFAFGSSKDSNNSNNFAEAQIKKIISNKETIINKEAPAAELVKTEIFEGEINFNGIIGKLNAKISGSDLVSIDLELENTIPPTNTEEEYIARTFLPKFIALRATGEASVNKSNRLTNSARINYQLGNDKKKLVSQITSILGPTNEFIIITTHSSDTEFNHENPNLINLDKNPDGGISLLSQIKVPIKKMDINNIPTRSISELIDNQVNSSEDTGAKKEKTKSKKKKLDE